MRRSIAHCTLVVRDYDEAIAFFTDILRFRLVEDTPLDNGKRWVVVAPSGPSGMSLLLARAATPEQQRRIGDQTGGRVAFFLYTSDFDGDCEHIKACGVRFAEEPRREAYGPVVIFLDLYGNKWDLIGRERE